MTNAKRLLEHMAQGRVYRRQELEGVTSAGDRDLKTLVDSGDVQKLSGGLYFKTSRNPFGVTPPDMRDLVRAFLKTDDFLLTSNNHFNQLGLGLTQVYNSYVVYNHKRSGEFALNGMRLRFRVVPAYPAELSKEFLLVDLLNNLKHLPDNAGLVLQNLPARVHEFDRAELDKQLELYGRPAARAALREARV